MRQQFTYKDFEACRTVPGSSMGIFLTSFCPVLCEHCVVDAGVKCSDPSPSILLERVHEVANLKKVRVVAITGGEPFSRISLLHSIVEILGSKQKRIVIYTSCYWGSEQIPKKIRRILTLTAGIIVGVDCFHRKRISDDTLFHAFKYAADAGVWLTIQALRGKGHEKHWQYAKKILKFTFGTKWDEHARMVPISLIASGRAKTIFQSNNDRNDLKKVCKAINGPTLIQDGSLVACCNDTVIRCQKPSVFHVKTGSGLKQALDQLNSHHIVELVRLIPPYIVLELALIITKKENIRLAPRSACEACWLAAELLETMNCKQLQLCKIFAADIAQLLKTNLQSVMEKVSHSKNNKKICTI